MRDDRVWPVLVVVLLIVGIPVGAFLWWVAADTRAERQACEARGGVHRDFRGGDLCIDPEVLR